MGLCAFGGSVARNSLLTEGSVAAAPRRRRKAGAGIIGVCLDTGARMSADTVRQLLQSHRSIRQYHDRPLDDALVDEVL